MAAFQIIKRYSDVFVINIGSFIIGLTLYFIFCHRIELLVVTISTGISLAIGLRQYRTENDKIFKELFIKFNESYDSKFNDALRRIDTSNKLEEGDEILVIDYLNLCAEEYLWFSKDRIPSEVWISWENGMIYYFNVGCINSLVLTEKNQQDSYYGLFNKIGHRIEGWS